MMAGQKRTLRKTGKTGALGCRMIGLGEVAQRLGRGVADRLYRDALGGEGITDRNQPIS